MAVLTVRMHTDEILRKKASTVEKIDVRIRSLLDNMVDTLRFTGGVGLAAPQVGTSQRLFIIRNGMDYIKFVNPLILRSEGEQESLEACLSLPGIFGKVIRPARLVIKALDESGKPFVLEGYSQLARTLSHETDHLDGILFTDKAYLVRRTNRSHRPDTRRPSE